MMFSKTQNGVPQPSVYGGIIGATPQEARAQGHNIRIVEMDGASMVLTADHILNRINVAVAKGRITRIVFVG